MYKFPEYADFTGYGGIRFYGEDCDFPDHPVTKQLWGYWTIGMGFAGFNCPRNNGRGFKTKAAAVAVIRHYQKSGDKNEVRTHTC